MTIHYRNAGIEDAPALDRLFDSVFCETFAHLYRREDLEAFLSSFTIADWEAQLGDRAYAFRIAEADGEPVGYAKLGPLKSAIASDPSGVMLEQLYVANEHHGSGIARALMDWTLDEARRRGSTALYLTVFIDNQRARRFYGRYGFETAGRYAFMVGSQADEDIVMKKLL
jgi:GNAT superfamily N-acetyltransferase